MKSDIIHIENVTFSYGEKEILKNISLSIGEGESISIVGMSGLGKSTLLKLICDLPNSKAQKQTGDIKIRGIDNRIFINRNKGKIGFLFQTLSLFPNLTVEENIQLPSRMINKNVEKNDLMAIMEMVGLQKDKRKYVYELSGGMRTRVALASILLTKPEILLLDEPFSALDVKWKYELYKCFFELKSDYRTTDIIVTHDIHEAIILSDRVYVLMQSGTLSEPYCIDRSGLNIQVEENFKEFLKNNNETYLNIQEKILKDNSL